MNKPVKYKRTMPLCFMPNGKLLCYHKRQVLVLFEGQIEKKIPITVSFKERLFGWSKYMTRLLRFGVRAAEAIDDSLAVLNIGSRLYEVNVDNNSFSAGWDCGTGIRPLKFTTINNLEGFNDGVYFGGYLVNREKKPVNIYHRVGVDKWEVVYTFPEGSINHVHNIVADQYRQCLWIFTGDFDESAAIWKVNDNFHKIECIACSDQKYRGCVVSVIPEGLLYATDAPFANNYIYLMNPDTLETKSLFPIHGSCIYGCQWKDKYVFSSTVESDGRSPGRPRVFYNGNRGAGIKDDFVHLYFGNISEGFKEYYKEQKDCLSFLFQFGVFKFPYGLNNSDTLYFQPIATKTNDMNMVGIREKDFEHPTRIK